MASRTDRLMAPRPVRRFLPRTPGRPSPVRPATALLVQEARWRGIWRLYWPLALTMALQVAVGLVDTWIAGQIGAQALAIVGVILQVTFLVNAVTIAVGVGTHALVARLVGGNQWPEAAAAARQSLMLGAVLTVAVVAPLMAAAPMLYDALGLGPAGRGEGIAYLRLVLLGVVPMNVGIVLANVLRARAAMATLLLASAVEAGAWLFCSLALGLGLGLGLLGLGLGFLAGKALQVAVAWRTYRRSRLYEGASWRPDLSWHRRILRVGLPSAAHVLVRNVGGLAFYAVLGLLVFSTDAVAAYSIGLRLEAVAYLLVFGLGAVAATMVGQHLGAGRADRASKAVWRIMRLALGLAAALGLGAWWAADRLAMAFCEDPLVWNYASDFLRVTALALPAMAATVVLNGAFQGAGETRVPMTCALIGVAVGLPLAWALACPLGWGPTGAWWGMAAAGAVQAGLAAWWFMRGAWRTRRV